MPLLCPPKAFAVRSFCHVFVHAHVTTLVFIKFRIILLFSVKNETRKTLFSCCFFVCFMSDRNTLSCQFKGFFTHLKRKREKKRESKGAFLHTCKFLWLLLSWKHFKCQMLIRNSRLLSGICASWFYQVDLPGSVDLSCPPGPHLPCNRANHPCLSTGTLGLIKSVWYTSMQHTWTGTNSISPRTDRAVTPSDLPTCQLFMGLIEHACELPPDPRVNDKIRAIV